MDDRRDAVIAAHLLDEVRVVDVATHERRPEQRLDAPELQRVEDDDLAAGVAQGAHGVRADVAGAAGDAGRVIARDATGAVRRSRRGDASASTTATIN